MNLKGRRRILEVGCSNGRLLIRAKGVVNAEDAVGIDILKCGHSDSIMTARGDARELPLRDDSFDLVFSAGLLEHFTGDELQGVLSEQIRVLAEGGILVILVPNLTIGSARALKTFSLDLFRETRHYQWVPKSVKAHIEKHGIRILKEDYVGWAFHLGKFRFPAPRLLNRVRVTADDWLLIGVKDQRCS